jgi:hypothetical protein
MPSTDTKPELTAKASMAQPVSQPAVYANGLRERSKGSAAASKGVTFIIIIIIIIIKRNR